MASSEPTYDIIAVGTGFATTFFLHRALQHLPKNARVLVLERGKHESHGDRIKRRHTLGRAERKMYVAETDIKKSWRFNIGFGGGSNCWFACTPRMLPEDFEMKTRYGVGVDWPVKYDALETYYCEAEDLMEIAGPSESTPFPRSRPYPQPEHRMSDPDKLLKKAAPDKFFSHPCARPTKPTKSGRPGCCASGVCELCPIDSKFTVLNSMADLYEDPRVTLTLGANVIAVETTAGRASGIRYLVGKKEKVARGDFVVLGANAIFNPFILLKSGIDGPQVGRGLVEQVSVTGNLSFDGVDNFQGSTSITGHGYWIYGGEHRKKHAGALIETWNTPGLRNVRGKWRQRMMFKAIFEDLRREENHVKVSGDDPNKPLVVFKRRSDYAQRGIRKAAELLEPVFANALPLEEFSVGKNAHSTEAHIIGTTIMGTDPAASVIDADHLHHSVRNLAIVGSSVFPTAAPANPTLTISALSLRSADRLFGPAGVAKAAAAAAPPTAPASAESAAPAGDSAAPPSGDANAQTPSGPPTSGR